MYRTIMVPLDDSPLGERALPLALDLAWRTGATLHLVHIHLPIITPVYSPEVPIIHPQLDDQICAEMHDYLKNLALKLRVETPVTVRHTLLRAQVGESVARKLADYSQRVGADLLVMTTHGRGGLGRLWLGSVADELVRRVRMPILLVRPDEQVPELGQPWEPKRILIPLDGSATAEAILPHAQKMAQTTQAACTLMRVVEPAMLTRHFPADASVHRLDQQYLDILRLEAQTYLSAQADMLREQELTVDTCDQVAPQAANSIVEMAQEGQYGLIAMATHGRRGLNRLLVGSVADKVLRSAPIPLLIYRPTVLAKEVEVDLQAVA
jgi:nucleotide-binding universal stress UspA family protein